MLMGAATFNLFYSFLAGLLMFGGLCGFAVWATRQDDMLRILLGRHGIGAGSIPAKHERMDIGGGMMRIGRILRDYAEAGAVNPDRALWGFVTDDGIPHEERSRRAGVSDPGTGRRGD